LSFSRKAACSPVISIALLGIGLASSASQRSIFVPRPLSFRIFWIVIAETRMPSSASIASCRLQP
jgi:hypothetical protein